MNKQPPVLDQPLKIPGLGEAFRVSLQRELLLAFRRRSDIANPLVFFALVITLFPLGISPDPEFLAQIAPGVLWVAALLATMLSLDTLFRADFDDGGLEQLMLSPHPLSLLVLAKVLSHWLVSGFLLTLLAPLLALMLFLPIESMWVLLASLALGTPILSLVGAIGAGLTVGLKKGGVLLSLLVLPLFIPVLIFGAGAVQAAADGLPVLGHLALLGAMLSLALVLAPLATAASLRISLNG